MSQQHNYIILIETSTSLCSTAICDGTSVVARRISETPRSQASLTAPFVAEMLSELGLSVRDCSAVCVSSGPGSYTGLRVGVSTAKGLCFGAGIPLLSVSTLDTLVAQAFADGLVPSGCKWIVPMIDARRMEVYTAAYKCNLQGTSSDACSSVLPSQVNGCASGNEGINNVVRVTDIAPVIVDADFFASQGIDPSEGVLIIGDAADKCREVLCSAVLAGTPAGASAGADSEACAASEARAAGDATAAAKLHFAQQCPRADAMAVPAFSKFTAGSFENVAYFEPFYLKEFVATVSKKNLF